MRTRASVSSIFVALQILITVVLLSTPNVYAAESCILDAENSALPIKSADHYLKLVEYDREGANDSPGFIDPVKEAKLADEKWVGTQEVPQAVLDTLLPNVSVLEFQTRTPDAGMVGPAETGDYITARFEQTWRGMNLSTNLGMPITAALARGIEKSPYLVPETAKAIYIFDHGGGTKTTGQHVAAAFANWMIKYGIVVISLDAPFHAYGSRADKLDPLMTVQHRVDFIKEFLPPGVPVIDAGHSKGGADADLLMRLSDQDELGIKDVLAAVVSLSTPIDSAPGQSRSEKARIEKEIQSNEDLMAQIPEAEQDLNAKMLREGKVSALGGYFSGLLMAMMDWALPEHGGDDFLPALYIMGEKDALYLGQEKVFEEYVTDLSNTETHIIGKRKNFKGRDLDTGHMIFDHYAPGTQDMETFQLILKFTERILGQEFEKAKKTPNLLSDPSSASPHLGVMKLVIQSYYNNLAFRKFAESYPILSKKGTAKAIEIGGRSKALFRERSDLAKQIKPLRKDAEANKEAIDALTEQEATINLELKELMSFQTSTHIPEDGPLKDFATENVNRRLEIENLLDQSTRTKQKQYKDLAQLRAEREVLNKKIARAVEEELQRPTLESPDLVAKREAFYQVWEKTLDLQEKMNDIISARVDEQVIEGDLSVSPTAEQITSSEKLDEAYGQYVQAEAAFKSLLESAAARGELGDELPGLIEQLWGSLEAHTQKEPAAQSLLAEIESLRSDLNAQEVTDARLQKESDALEMEYVEKVTPDYFTVRMTTLAKEMDRPLTELSTSVTDIVAAWEIWLKIWKQRAPEETTSLYKVDP